MTNSEKPNVTVASNIYVRTAPALQGDDAFIKSVYGHRALNILKSRFPKSYASRLTRAQIEEMKQNVVCRAGKTREHAYGKALANNKIVWSCRCENTGCYAYERCMGLPNALRIKRGAASEGEIPAEPNGYGFDYDRCSFEPPVSKVAEKPEKYRGGEIAAVPVEASYGVFPHPAEKPAFDPNIRTLIICESVQEAGFLSTILYGEGIRHRSLCSEGYTLHRRIADVFWDYCGEEIEREAFLDRYAVRADASYKEAREFYRALFEMCGNPETETLRIDVLADALSGSGTVSERMLNMEDPDCPVTIATLGGQTDGVYDKVLALEGANAPLSFAPYSKERFGDGSATVIKKGDPANWVFGKSPAGRRYRVVRGNYRGEHSRCLNVELGLWGDVDCKSFLADETGDAIRLQLYIAENIKAGDELTIEKNAVTGGYSFYHKGNALGGFPEAAIREIREIDGFPEDFSAFGGVYVRNIITCVGDRDDATLPARFRESRIWLGLEITGYAKVKV
ncbi:MAG: hypothetical protein LBI38_04460 [Oscillospiraceae bacterium]|jgi:hypothetical protein|nr:hypothetical protein [Oscillospiraceae bacterium]